jgi:membrane-associated phospholipid phosphatase
MLLASAFWVGIERPRPPWVYERVLESKAQDETTLETCATVPDTLIVRRHKAGSPSFPSRHALTAGVLAMALTLAWRWVGLAAWLYALLVAIGRVHSGVHWPTDVIAGLAIGALVAWGTWRVTPRILRRVGLGRLTEIEEPREAQGGADGSGPGDDSAEPGGAGAPLG